MDIEYSVIDINSEVYPDKLRSITNPPTKLYCSGDLSLLGQESIGVVGSRKYTLYGKVTAGMIGERLAKYGVPVVSGLAYGIDAFAHEGTLNAGGPAIAVLGMGFNKFSPVKNQSLYERVLKHGLVVSEYEPDQQGAPYSFPARNRIISGLSKSVVIVEAGMKSGSLITAQFALEQGRNVYAVPGNINSQFSVGTNFLIRDGATPLIVIDDIISDLGINPMKVLDTELDIGEDEQEIVELISRESGITVNNVARILDKRISAVNSILTVLEIKGIVECFSGRLYLKKFSSDMNAESETNELS